MSKIRRQLETVLCPSREHALDCHCEKLRSLYGRGLFKCDKYHCQYYHLGFETRSDRDTNLRIHDRPFKCSVPNCEFADIGFTSNVDLTRHTSKIHHTPLSAVNIAAKLPDDQFKPSNFLSLLEDAVQADEIDFVRSHYPRAKNLKEWEERYPKTLVEIAAKTASPTMVEFLLTESEPSGIFNRPIKDYALYSAVRGENMTVIQHLLVRGAKANCRPVYGTTIIEAALQTWSVEIVELLLSHGANLIEIPSLFCPLLESAEIKEDMVLEILDRMHKYIVGKKAFSRGYYDSIYCRGSIVLAKYFLDNGADVNFTYGSLPTVLYMVVKNFSHRKVEFVIFLLQQGANPYPKRRSGITALSGMRKLEGDLGKSWEDLVREVQADRTTQRINGSS